MEIEESHSEKVRTELDYHFPMVSGSNESTFTISPDFRKNTFGHWTDFREKVFRYRNMSPCWVVLFMILVAVVG